MQFKAIVEGAVIEGSIERLPDGRVEAKAGDRVYTLHWSPVEPRVSWVQWGNRSLEIGVVRTQETYSVAIGDAVLQVELEDPRTVLRRAAIQGHAQTAELRAPMPGRVVRLLVKEGDTVEANQAVVVVEAMKMQNEIKSPKAGIVKSIAAAEGATVNSGELLATVE